MNLPCPSTLSPVPPFWCLPASRLNLISGSSSGYTSQVEKRFSPTELVRFFSPPAFVFGGPFFTGIESKIAPPLFSTPFVSSSLFLTAILGLLPPFASSLNLPLVALMTLRPGLVACGFRVFFLVVCSPTVFFLGFCPEFVFLHPTCFFSPLVRVFVSCQH